MSTTPHPDPASDPSSVSDDRVGNPTPPTWAEQAALLLDLAVSDLETGHDVIPTMVAFRGDDPLFLASLRPFVKGEHHDPIIEISALAMALGADRVMLSLSGRAWSLHDPIPPVLEGTGDLRQRVVVLHQADATGEGPATLSTIVPIDGPPPGQEGAVRTGPHLTEEALTGWVTQALHVVVSVPDAPPDLEQVGLQLRRCEQLGHRVAWAPALTPTIDEARMVALCGSEGEATSPRRAA